MRNNKLIYEYSYDFTHTLAIDVLNSIPQYVNEFKLVFGTDKIDIDQVTQAIAEFEKTLVTPNSRFDQWLMGNNDALTDKEKMGYQLSIPIDSIRSYRVTGGCNNSRL